MLGYMLWGYSKRKIRKGENINYANGGDFRINLTGLEVNSSNKPVKVISNIKEGEQIKKNQVS